MPTSGTAQNLGIGDIIMSVLDEETFESQHGGAPGTGIQPTWVLCDGRDVHDSAYARLSGKRFVPDFVGRYPRGEDVDAKTGVHTPAVGGQMPDAFGSHNHILVDGVNGWGVMGDAQGGGDNQVLRTGYGGTIHTSYSGDQETRPKTTVVNFFIRIN